jgi:signal peptidase I
MSQQDPPRGALAEWTGTAILLLFAISTLGQAYVIPTSSMEDTLLIGDHVWVDKVAYAPPGRFTERFLPYTPLRRGDIIVFRPPIDTSDPYVKRVIGVPGDRIRVVNKQVHLNGKPLQEPYKFHKTDYVDPYRDNFPSTPNAPLYPGAIDMLKNHVVDGEVVVPPGHYFAMGDNRDHSLDSRYWGFVSRERIIGKPVIIWWSYDAPTERLQSMIPSADHVFDLATNFFRKTRWSRTFQLVRGYALHP